MNFRSGSEAVPRDRLQRAEFVIAVGTPVTQRPPLRSVQAQLRHTAPALSDDGKANVRPWMKNLGLWEKIIGQLCDPLPRKAVLLTAAPQRAQPEAANMVTEGAECREIGRHGMIDKVAPNDLRQPEALVGDRLVHPLSQLLLNLREFCPHSVTPGFPFKQELTPARASADENEPEEFEGFRFSEPAPRSSNRRMAAELEQAGLLRVE